MDLTDLSSKQVLATNLATPETLFGWVRFQITEMLCTIEYVIVVDYVEYPEATGERWGQKCPIHRLLQAER